MSCELWVLSGDSVLSWVPRQLSWTLLVLKYWQSEGLWERAWLAWRKPASEEALIRFILNKVTVVMRQMGPVFGMQIWPAEPHPGRAARGKPA